MRGNAFMYLIGLEIGEGGAGLDDIRREIVKTTR